MGFVTEQFKSEPATEGYSGPGSTGSKIIVAAPPPPVIMRQIGLKKHRKKGKHKRARFMKKRGQGRLPQMMNMSGMSDWSEGSGPVALNNDGHFVGMGAPSFLSQIKAQVKEAGKKGLDTLKSETISRVTTTTLANEKVQKSLSDSAKASAAEAAAKYAEESISRTQKFLATTQGKVVVFGGLAAVLAGVVYLLKPKRRTA